MVFYLYSNDTINILSEFLEIFAKPLYKYDQLFWRQRTEAQFTVNRRHFWYLLVNLVSSLTLIGRETWNTLRLLTENSYMHDCEPAGYYLSGSCEKYLVYVRGQWSRCYIWPPCVEEHFQSKLLTLLYRIPVTVMFWNVKRNDKYLVRQIWKTWFTWRLTKVFLKEPKRLQRK